MSDLESGVGDFEDNMQLVRSWVRDNGREGELARRWSKYSFEHNPYGPEPGHLSTYF